MAEKDTTQKTGIFDFFINHSKKAMIGIVCVSVLVLTATVAGHLMKEKQETIDPNVVAEVGGEKIYLKDYKERLFAAEGGYGTPAKPAVYEATGAIKESVLNDLAELKLVDKELTKKHIIISDAELVQEAKKIFKDYATRDVISQKAYKNYVRLNIGKNKIITEAVTWKEGFVLFCLNNRAAMEDMADKPDSVATLARDKSYAEEYCKNMKQRLEVGQSDFQSELAKLKADPLLGDERWKPMSMTHGIELKKENFVDSSYLPYNILESISSFQKNKYYLVTLKERSSSNTKNKQDSTKINNTSPISQVSDKGESQATNADSNSLFGVLYIKDGNTGEAVDLKSWLEQKKKEYNVKTYLERIKL